MGEELFTLVMLSVFAWQDEKKKCINICMVFAAIAFALLYKGFKADTEAADVILGAAVGLSMILAAVFSKEQIGLADGFVFIFTGIMLGLWGNIILLFLSLGLSVIYAFYLIAVKKKSRKYEFAFLPFSLISYVAFLAMGGMV